MLFDETIRALLYFVACAILFNALDDAFIDVLYFWRGLGRKVSKPLSLDALRAQPQKRIAIVVPAWQEAAVISDMLEHNLSSIDYDNYVIFCGTYQNDPDTQACVERVSTRSNRVRNVIVPHDGPTSKADCLNWVYQGVLLEQERSGVEFDILLMHDAEDVIHPVSLRLYNQLIPDYEFVQTPVFSLELPASHLVAGTYIDEFSEHHLKDMLVRQSLNGLVPSAGVGSAFDYSAFRSIATAHGHKPFNVDSLTEDYEIGLKFRLAGRRVCFACHTLEVPAREPSRKGYKRKTQLEYIATREYFPSGAWASVRQRSRWICGITLQTWQQLGFVGPLVVRYCLMRDRKALFTNTVLLCGYAVLLLMSGVWLGAAIADSTWNWQRVITPESALYWLLLVNTSSALWRACMKAYFVGRLHGPLQAALSLPRLFVGNCIGVLATARAVVQYTKHRITGEPLRWVKTSHAFPSTSVLKTRQRALGELLLSRGHVNEPDLADALGWHRAAGLPLGEVLTVSGLAHSDAVIAALAERWGMEPADNLDPMYVALSLLQLVAEAEAEALDVLPYEHESDHVSVIVSEPLLPKTRALLEARFAATVQPLLASRAALQRVRASAYRRLQRHPEEQVRAASVPPSARPAGERLIEAGLLSPSEVERVLAEQRATGELFGESLLRSLPVAPQSIPPEISIGHADLQRIDLEHVDVLGVYLIGYASCALYCCLPLSSENSGVKLLASPFPLPQNLIDRVQSLLDCSIRVVCAPALQVRAGLAHSLTQMRMALGSKLSGVGGIDAEELKVIMLERVTSMSEAELVRASRSAAVSPIDLLERRGELDADGAARLRASALGIDWLPSNAPPALRVVTGPPGSDAPRASVLPPSFLEAHRIRVISEDGPTLCLAAPRPTPQLTRMAGRWLPDRVIEWRVAA